MIRFNSSGNFSTIYLDRPHRAHAYTPDVLTQLERAIQLSLEKSVCIISSTGERHFCAGADTDSLQGRKAKDALDLQSQKVFNSIASSPTIFIAAIHGAAIAGGFELALACDLRVVHPDSFFRLPELSLGLIPAAGGCTRLVKLVGESIAKGIILGGDDMSAQKGRDFGLFHRVSNSPIEEAMSWADKISKNDVHALRFAKRVLNQPSLLNERLAEAYLYDRKAELND